MVKRVTKKNPSKVNDQNTSSIDRLIESNIALQHKMADVLLGVKELNENVTGLMQLFKSAGEHIKSGKYEDPMIHKLNELLEQNQKLIKALALVEKYIQEKRSSPSPSFSTATTPY